MMMILNAYRDYYNIKRMPSENIARIANVVKFRRQENMIMIQDILLNLPFRCLINKPCTHEKSACFKVDNH